MSQELVTYIVLGSKTRLKNVKLPSDNKYEEFILLNQTEALTNENHIDQLISSAKGDIIVLLPPSSFPNNDAKEALKKIALIGLSSWGWFEFNQARKNIIQNIKRVSTIVRSIPNLEQGIYFSKRLYFSVGGMGVFDSLSLIHI